MTAPHSALSQIQDGPARAVLYLRVSTKEQARRDGNAEGYSLPTQREAGLARAEALGATVIEEYLDKDTGTAMAKRPAMQKLLRRVEEKQDVDYVIVHKLDRWARNTREDLVATSRLKSLVLSLSRARKRSTARRRDACCTPCWPRSTSTTLAT